ncbi:MAG: hypothetical protein ACI9BD_000210 [Candidatus Marinamargulisbacteria bacterium]|jgi:hypothetical protein
MLIKRPSSAPHHSSRFSHKNSKRIKIFRCLSIPKHVNTLSEESIKKHQITQIFSVFSESRPVVLLKGVRLAITTEFNIGLNAQKIRQKQTNSSNDSVSSKLIHFLQQHSEKRDGKKQQKIKTVIDGGTVSMRLILLKFTGPSPVLEVLQNSCSDAKKDRHAPLKNTSVYLPLSRFILAIFTSFPRKISYFLKIFGILLENGRVFRDVLLSCPSISDEVSISMSLGSH